MFLDQDTMNQGFQFLDSKFQRCRGRPKLLSMHQDRPKRETNSCVLKTYRNQDTVAQSSNFSNALKNMKDYKEHAMHENMKLLLSQN
jgi:hypothetical protein